MKFVDLSGRLFSLLTVLKKKGHNRHGQILWECRCTCGKICIKSLSNLLNMKSCGCKQNIKPIRHGYAKRGCPNRTYTSWTSMLTRCRNPKSSIYKYYGGRGIRVSKRWEKFENFLEDMGIRPGKGKEFTLDRKNVNGNYWKRNCRWATPNQQSKNRRSF